MTKSLEQESEGRAEPLEGPTLTSSRSFRPVLALMVIGVASHWEWFVIGYQFRWGDSTGVPSAAFPQFGDSYVNWLSLTGLGQVNIQPYQLMFFQLWHFLASLGANFPLTEQITMLWPIALFSFISPFLFIRKLLNSEVAGFAGALVYGFGTSLLVFEGFEIFLALAFSLLPLALFAVDFYLEKQTWSRLFLFVICFNSLIYIDVRVAFLAGLLLLWYVTFLIGYGHRRITNWWKLLAIGGLFASLNAFWLVVTTTSSSSSIASTSGRAIFGNEFTDFFHAITLVSGSWVNGSLVPFTLSPIPPIMWTIPILALAGAFARSPDAELPRWAVTVFAATVALAGVMLATQANPPFSAIFPFFYRHVPGFSLFRVGTDFFIVATLGYAILIGRLIEALKWSTAGVKEMSYGVLARAGLAAVMMFMLVPMMTGKVGGLFVHRTEPSGLTQVSRFIQQQQEFFRTLWLPSAPNWSTYSLQHPAVGAVDLLSTGGPLQSAAAFGTSYGTAVTSKIGSAAGIATLRDYSIRYLILPPPDSSNTSPLFSEYGEARGFYLAWLHRQTWLKQIARPFGDYAVFEIVGDRASQLVQGATNSDVQSSSVINSNLLIAELSSYPKTGSGISVGMSYNQNWHAYFVPLQVLADTCGISARRIRECGTSPGFKLLLQLQSDRWPALSPARGAHGQLNFKVARNDAGNGRLAIGPGPVGLVVVFGDALRNLFLLLVAESVLIVISALLMLNFARNVWFHRRLRGRRAVLSEPPSQP